LFKSRFLNDRGAGLILVLVVCSVIGAAAVYLMDLSKESEKKITADARVLSYNSLVTLVTNKLHSGTTCTDVLPKTNGLDISSAFDEDGMSVELDLKLNINPRILKKPNCPICTSQPNHKDCVTCPDRWYLQGGTSIKDVLLVVNERVREPVQLDIDNDPKLVAATGYILIMPNHGGVGFKLSRNKHYKIPIFLYYERQGGQKIMRACFNPNGEALFCTSIGGAYNWKEALPDNQRCQPDLTCFAYKSGISTSQFCPPPYKRAPIGWTGNQLYLCNWCNRNGLGANQQDIGYYFNPRPTTKEEMDNPPPPVSPIITP
jgi:hypothetical protein